MKNKFHAKDIRPRRSTNAVKGLSKKGRAQAGGGVGGGGGGQTFHVVSTHGGEYVCCSFTLVLCYGPAEKNSPTREETHFNAHTPFDPDVVITPSWGN